MEVGGTDEASRAASDAELALVEDTRAGMSANCARSSQPARLDRMSRFHESRRGQGGRQLVWATGASACSPARATHLMVLLFASGQQGGDLTPILARAAELARTDATRKLALAQVAAEALVRPLRKTQPSHDLLQLVAHRAQQGRLGEALADLDAAQDAGTNDAVDLATVRGELAQIVELAGRIAVGSTGEGRAQAVAGSSAGASSPARWRSGSR